MKTCERERKNWRQGSLKGFFSYVEFQIELLISSISTCNNVSKMSVCNTDKSSFSKMSTVYLDEHIVWRMKVVSLPQNFLTF